MVQKLPVAASKIFLGAFIPYRIQQQKLISEYHDKPSERQELADVFAELGIKWKWQPLTLENMQAVDDQTSVGNILRFSGTPFAQLMSEMIGGAFDRHSTKSQ